MEINQQAIGELTLKQIQGKYGVDKENIVLIWSTQYPVVTISVNVNAQTNINGCYYRDTLLWLEMTDVTTLFSNEPTIDLRFTLLEKTEDRSAFRTAQERGFEGIDPDKHPWLLECPLKDLWKLQLKVIRCLSKSKWSRQLHQHQRDKIQRLRKQLGLIADEKPNR